MTITYKTKKVLIEIVGASIVFCLFALMTAVMFITIGGISFTIYKLVTLL